MKALVTDGIFASIDLFYIMKVNNLLYKELCQDNNLRKCEVSASAKGLLLYFDRGHWIWIVLRDLSYYFHEPILLSTYRNIALFSKFAECFMPWWGQQNGIDEILFRCNSVWLENSKMLMYVNSHDDLPYTQLLNFQMSLSAT